MSDIINFERILPPVKYSFFTLFLNIVGRERGIGLGIFFNDSVTGSGKGLGKFGVRVLHPISNKKGSIKKYFFNIVEKPLRKYEVLVYYQVALLVLGLNPKYEIEITKPVKVMRADVFLMLIG